MNIDATLSKVLIKIQFSQEDSRAVGTGFFITPSGLILTCYHVIAGLKSIWGIWDREKTPVELEYIEECSYPQKDFAVLKACAPSASVIQSLPLSLKWTPGDKIYTKGFQYENHDFDSFPAWGTITGTTYERKYECPLMVIEQAQNIQEGISGAPGWNIRTKSIIGIVTANWNEKVTGFMIPIKEFVYHLKEIRNGNSEKILSFINSINRQLIADEQAYGDCMKDQYTKLCDWLYKLTPKEYEELVFSLLDVVDQNHLTDPTSKSSFLNDMRIWRRLGEVEEYLRRKYPIRFL